MSKKITMEDFSLSVADLFQMYIEEDLSQREIAKRVGVSQATISIWLRDNNIKKSNKRYKYDISKRFFDVIDTEEKAYWLGFIWCDGSNIKRSNDSYQFKVTLSEKDEEHLYKFRESVNSNHPITKSKTKTGFQTKYKMVAITVQDQIFCEILYKNYGMKSHRHCIEKLVENVPQNLIRHFIRGVLDADGSLQHGIAKGHSYLTMKVRFYTYEKLAEFIQNHLINIGLVKRTKLAKRHKHRDKHAIGLEYGGAVQVPKVLDYLYEDSTIFMNRKYNTYLEIKQLLKEREEKKYAV